MNGVGANNTCSMHTLGGQAVTLFGLDPDGDVDGNDKLYTSLHCAATPPGNVGLAPCKSGEFVDGKIGSSWTCAPVAVAIVNFIHDNCSLYTGWQDGCDGCVTPPGKWGCIAGTRCMNGAGGDNTCSTAMLDNASVTLFGLNPDGDVDGNDAALHHAARGDDDADDGLPRRSVRRRDERGRLRVREPRASPCSTSPSTARSITAGAMAATVARARRRSGDARARRRA